MILITDEDAQKAANYLRDIAEEAAVARAERKHVEEYRKIVKAEIMKEHGEESGVIQEREAYADKRYKKHLEAIKDAVKADARYEFMREAAMTKISVWQTLSKNIRGVT